MPSHSIPNARTGPQPDMMWRTNAVEIQQLTHCQSSKRLIADGTLNTSPLLCRIK